MVEWMAECSVATMAVTMAAWSVLQKVVRMEYSMVVSREAKMVLTKELLMVEKKE